MSQNQVNSGQVAGSLTNLLVNGGFEIWQRGATPTYGVNAFAADRWQGANATVLINNFGQDATNADSASHFGMFVQLGVGSPSAIGSGGIPTNYAAAFQKLEDFYQLRGRTVSFSMRVRSSVAGTAALALVDSGSTVTWGAVAATGTAYTTLTATATIGAAASSVSAYVFFGTASCTYTLDNAMLVVGLTPVNYIPLSAAEDWIRCLRYYEIALKSASVLGSPAQGGGQRSFNNVAFASKAVAPTITAVGTPSFVNCAFASFFGSDLNSICYAITATAAGEQFVQFSATAYLTIEANP